MLLVEVVNREVHRCMVMDLGMDRHKVVGRGEFGVRDLLLPMALRSGILAGLFIVDSFASALLYSERRGRIKQKKKKNHRRYQTNRKIKTLPSQSHFSSVERKRHCVITNCASP